MPAASCKIFLSTPSSQRATRMRPYMRAMFLFLSTPSSQRATGECSTIHLAAPFLSTPSSQRATLRRRNPSRPDNIFLSTPSSQRATNISRKGHTAHDISIHALFAEGDRGATTSHLELMDFYPRPLRRGRPRRVGLTDQTMQFLSTPSSQRATTRINGSLSGSYGFLSTPSSQRATEDQKQNV